MASGEPPLSFNERADRMLARISYRRALDDRTRDEIFRLRHDGYVRDGGIEPQASGRFCDPWDDVPNGDLIGVYLDDRIAGTVRVHVSGPHDDVPGSDPFGDVLKPFLDRGLVLVDATRFVIDYRHAAFSAEMPFLTLRAVAMAAEHFGAYGMIAAVRREHAVVYRRVTDHRALCEPRAYPLLRKPIVCMVAETAALENGAYARHPFLRSTPEERERLFGPRVPKPSDADAIADFATGSTVPDGNMRL